ADTARRRRLRGTGRRCGPGACRRWASDSARGRGRAGCPRTAGSGSCLGSLTAAGEEVLRHFPVPPDAEELEIFAAVVEAAMERARPEERDVPGAERGLLPVALDHRLAAD